MALPVLLGLGALGIAAAAAMLGKKDAGSVAAPPSAPPVDGTKSEPPPTLDRGIPYDEAKATATALALETEPEKVSEFATSMLPDFPIAAGLLSAKGRFLDAAKKIPAPTSTVSGGGSMNPISDLAKATAGLGTLVTASMQNVAAHVLSAPIPELQSDAEALMAHLHSGTTTRGWNDDVNVGTDIHEVVENFGLDPNRHDRQWTAWAMYLTKHPEGCATPNDLIKAGVITRKQYNAAHGGWFAANHKDNERYCPRDTDERKLGRVLSNAASDVGDVVKGAAQIAQVVLPLIPGIGTIASIAIGAGIALASGSPIGDAVVAGLSHAVPGGELAQRGVKAGVAIGKSLIQGQRIDRAFMNATRDQIPAGPAQAAFDTGLALAQGKPIGPAALNALRAELPEGTGKAAFDAGLAFAKGKNVGAAALAVARGQVPAGSAQAIFDAGVAIAKGQPVGKAAMDAISGQMTPGLKSAWSAAAGIARGEVGPAIALIRMGLQTPEAQKAFDSALAVTHAKALQDAGFAILNPLLPGDSLAAKSLDFTKELAEAAAKKVPVAEMLEDKTIQALRKANAKPADLDRAVGEIIKNPGLSAMNSNQLAKAMGISEPVARASLGSIKQLAPTNAHLGQPIMTTVTKLKGLPVVVMGARLNKFKDALKPARTVSLVKLPPKAAPPSPPTVPPNPTRAKWVQYYVNLPRQAASSGWAYIPGDPRSQAWKEMGEWVGPVESFDIV